MSELLVFEKISTNNANDYPSLFETPAAWEYDLTGGSEDFLFPDKNLNPGTNDIMYVLMYFENVAGGATSIISLLRSVDDSVDTDQFVQVPDSEQLLPLAAALSVDWNYDAMGWTRNAIRYEEVVALTGKIKKIFVGFKNRR